MPLKFRVGVLPLYSLKKIKAMLIAGVIVHPSIPSQTTMARGTNAYGLDARDRRFDSGCAARFFRYEISVMNHQVESEGTARFFFHFEIMESPHIFFL